MKHSGVGWVAVMRPENGSIMPSKPGSIPNSNLRDRLVFARVGWCRLYNETPGDEPLRGGSFTDDYVGSEFANFSVLTGRVYGYVRIGLRGQMNRLRVSGSRAGGLDDVAVALFATPPGGSGQVLVGWHRHALMTSHAYPERPGGKYGVYVWPTQAKHAVLLPVGMRHVPIPKGPGGTGEQNVTYSRDERGVLRRDAAWIGRVRRFIESYAGPSLVGLDERRSNEVVVADEAEALLRGQNILRNTEMRAAIEHRAMVKVRAALRDENCHEIEDVSGWESFDFSCRRGNVWRKIEVKGTRTLGEALLFSDAEVSLAESERVDLYVVSDIELSGNADDGWKASGGNVRIVKDWGGKDFDRTAIGWRVIL